MIFLGQCHNQFEIVLECNLDFPWSVIAKSGYGVVVMWWYGGVGLCTTAYLGSAFLPGFSLLL